jgi:serine/threonine protein kinase
VPVQPGTRLGAYEVKQLLGHGAMGTVYLARHEELDRTAAVKVMQGFGDDAVARGRFRREGRAIALLRHPNIVTVYDYGEFEGPPFMIEEYIAGGSLAARIESQGGRPCRPPSGGCGAWPPASITHTRKWKTADEQLVSDGREREALPAFPQIAGGAVR